MSHSLAEQQQIHPTRERIAKSTAYDAGDPLNSSEEHRRPARLCTPWDMYAKPCNTGAQTPLEPHQISAGNHYALDYVKAGYGRLPNPAYEPAVDNSLRDEPTWIWDARSRIAQAQRALRAYELDLLHAVLFHGRAAKDWAKATGRHARGGLDYLRDTLDAIAPIWKLAPRKRT